MATIEISAAQRAIMAQAEPSLGSVYGKPEISAAVRAIRASMSPDVGFHARKETLDFEAMFSTLCGTNHAVALNGAGGAIDLVIRALNIQEGDEIVSCPIGFPGTHLAVIGSGARLVFSEPDPKTINLDPKDLARRLTPRTKVRRQFKQTNLLLPVESNPFRFDSP